jgi:hypothetical protein
VRAAGDPWERAADRAAAYAVRGDPRAAQESLAAGAVRASGPGVDRSAQAGLAGSTESMVDRQGGPVQGAVATEIAAVGGGQPIAGPLRTTMERAYGVPLGGVQVHDDSRADQLATSLAADAFTNGNDVFFRTGRYQPGTADGANLVAHEMAHVVQQRTSGLESAAVPIGRKIGLEFEYPNWQTADTKASQFAAATTPPIMPATMTNVWRPIPKGKPLVRGAGFELQGEDHSAGRSALEVVTDPFDESTTGRGQLRTAMLGIHATLTDVGANFNNWYNAGHLPRSTDLQGNAVRPNSFIYPAGGGQFVAKTQATVGLRLDKVANLLEDMFPTGARAGATGVAGEAAPTTADRRQGRQELTGWDSSGAPGPGQILLIQGAAPDQARQAIQAYRAVNLGAPAATDNLTGLLSLIVAYLRMADQNRVTSYAKTVAPVMARTDFSALFGMLSPAEQTWYKANGGQRFFDLVQAAPWLTTMNLADEVFAHGVQNPTHGVGQAQGLSRGKWLKGIPKGTDYLTGKKFPDKAQRKDIEGLGAYGKKTDAIDLGAGQTVKAAILELRSMPQVPLNNLQAVADRLFLYSYLVNRGGGGAGEKYGQVNAPF